MIHQKSYDELDLYKSTKIKEAIGKERILLSQKVQKINEKKRSQQRTMLITDRAIYNITLGGVFSRTEIKRRIKLLKIAGITWSTKSTQFVIHVRDEYDYRYKTNKRV